MRRTQRILSPVVAVLVAIVVVLVEKLPIAFLPVLLCFSFLYVLGVSGGGRAIARWHARRKG